LKFEPIYVVDASVAVKLVIPEEHSGEAEELFGLLALPSPTVIAAPDLLTIECANVLRSRVKRRMMTAATAREALEALRALPIETTSAADDVAEALAFALEHDISAYDACYVRLAIRLGAPLVTADRKLLIALQKHAVPALWLGDAPGRKR
jgi:predicted nucleic acid-binding protein